MSALSITMESFQRRFQDRTYSDLTLISAEHQYNAHRIIVCTSSSVIEGKCEAQLKDATLSEDGKADSTTMCTFDFGDDDPEAVDCLVRYLYGFGYPYKAEDQAEEGDNPSGNPVFSRKGNSDPERSDPILHVRVYALADKYEVPGLKRAALERFKQAVPHLVKTCGFLTASVESYTTAFAKDRGMRDEVVKAICSRRSELQKQLRDDGDAQTRLRAANDLLFDAFMYQSANPQPFGNPSGCW